MRDIVKRNGNGGNKVQLATTSYEVTEDQEEDLKVVSIKSKDFNSLIVTFNKAPKTGDVKVEKGSTVFYEGKVTSASNTVDLPYTVLSKKEGLTTLYGKNEDNVDVVVTVENYQDENKKIGKKVEKTINLKREDGKPAAAEKGHKLEVEWENKDKGILSSTPKITIVLTKGTDTNDIKAKDLDKVKVLDVNGIERTIDKVVLSSDKKSLVIELEKKDGDKQNFKELLPLTVVVEEGALEVDSDKIDVPSPKSTKEGDNWAISDYTNKLSNDKFEVKVDLEPEAEDEDSNFKYVEAVKEVNIDDENTNVITVEYTKSMSPSAAKLENYTFDGKTLPKGSSISMDATSKVVTIKLPKETVAKTYNTRLQISQDVKTALGEILVGNVAKRETYMTLKQLQITDNTAPIMVEGKLIIANKDQKVSNTLEIKLSEEIKTLDSNVKDTFEFVPTSSTKAVDVEKIELEKDDDEKDTILKVTLGTTVNVANGGTLRIKEDIKDTDETKLPTDKADNKMTKKASVAVKEAKVDSAIPGTDVDKEAAIKDAQQAVANAQAAKDAADQAVTDAQTALDNAIQARKDAINEDHTDVADEKAALVQAQQALETKMEEESVKDENDDKVATEKQTRDNAQTTLDQAIQARKDAIDEEHTDVADEKAALVQAKTDVQTAAQILADAQAALNVLING